MASKKKVTKKKAVNTRGYNEFVLIQDTNPEEVFCHEASLDVALAIAEDTVNNTDVEDDGAYSVAVYKLVAVVTVVRNTQLETVRVP